jgi:dynein heavy chain
LSFFHAVIQERKKFGKIGWNVSYDFNMSDYLISNELISMYLKKAHELGEEELPYDTLRYLIGEAMYGGRVTDNNDRRVLMTYLTEYLGNFIFDTNQKFFFSRAGADYAVPADDSHEATLEWIDEIPLFTTPGVFGLHPNAEIQSFSKAAKELWLNILEMQTSDGGGSGGVDREGMITGIADEIL